MASTQTLGQPFCYMYTSLSAVSELLHMLQHYLEGDLSCPQHSRELF